LAAARTLGKCGPANLSGAYHELRRRRSGAEGAAGSRAARRRQAPYPRRFGRGDRKRADRRPQALDEFDDLSGAPYRSGDEAEAARERIVGLLGPSPITLDELARAAEASARTVRVALLELELAGRVEYSGDRVALRTAADET
jgi:predicted Rossmann fold nucleotide-binding protein DprA/Smf involved in DNA uptake